MHNPSFDHSEFAGWEDHPHHGPHGPHGFEGPHGPRGFGGWRRGPFGFGGPRPFGPRGPEFEHMFALRQEMMALFQQLRATLAASASQETLASVKRILNQARTDLAGLASTATPSAGAEQPQPTSRTDDRML